MFLVALQIGVEDDVTVAHKELSIVGLQHRDQLEVPDPAAPPRQRGCMVEREEHWEQEKTKLKVL